MDSKERHESLSQNDPVTRPQTGTASANRERGDGFLAAGDQAIRRALGRNSRQFLTEAEQQGGE